MSGHVEKKLRDKLVSITEHLLDLKDQKKAELASFSEQIKGAEKKISCLSHTIKNGDLTYLANDFDEWDLEDLTKEDHGQ